MADVMRAGADNVQEKVVPASGHWRWKKTPRQPSPPFAISPDPTPLPRGPAVKGELRLTAVEVDQLARAGVVLERQASRASRHTILSGDPSKPGLYAA